MCWAVPCGGRCSASGTGGPGTRCRLTCPPAAPSAHHVRRPAKRAERNGEGRLRHRQGLAITQEAIDYVSQGHAGMPGSIQAAGHGQQRTDSRFCRIRSVASRISSCTREMESMAGLTGDMAPPGGAPEPAVVKVAGRPASSRRRGCSPAPSEPRPDLGQYRGGFATAIAESSLTCAGNSCCRARSSSHEPHSSIITPPHIQWRRTAPRTPCTRLTSPQLHRLPQRHSRLGTGHARRTQSTSTASGTPRPPQPPPALPAPSAPSHDGTRHQLSSPQPISSDRPSRTSRILDPKIPLKSAS